MANYRLPMDEDGVKYHGTVDQNEENPGQFMYGLDENGNKRIIRTDEQGNVLTRLTGSNVEEVVATDITVSSGSAAVVGSVDLSDFNSFSISARAATVHNFDLSIRFAFFDDRDTLDNGFIDVDYASKGNGVSIRLLSKRIDALGQRVRISIVNNTTTDQDYRWVRVYKYV